VCIRISVLSCVVDVLTWGRAVSRSISAHLFFISPTGTVSPMIKDLCTDDALFGRVLDESDCDSDEEEKNETEDRETRKRLDEEVEDCISIAQTTAHFDRVSRNARITPAMAKQAREEEQARKKKAAKKRRQRKKMQKV